MSITQDKARFRQALELAGDELLWTAKASTLDEAMHAFGTANTPVVLKPATGTGSRSVHLVRTNAELVVALASLETCDWPIVLEGYLSGPEYSVEAVSRNGVHLVLGVTEKLTSGPPNFIESGHTFPAPLSGDAQRSLMEYTSFVLDAVRHTDGLSHTEVIITDHGPVAVETHGRPGGDRITTLFELSTGQSMFPLVLGREHQSVPLDSEITAVIRFASFRTGTVYQVEGVEQALRLNGVHEVSMPRPGEDLRDVRSSSDRHGFVVASASTATEAMNLTQQAISIITVR